MKFLELTGFGNKHKHLISLRSISDIEFLSNYTTILLNNGHTVNVIENDEEVMNILEMAGIALYDEGPLDNEVSSRLA